MMESVPKIEPTDKSKIKRDMLVKVTPNACPIQSKIPPIRHVETGLITALVSTWVQLLSFLLKGWRNKRRACLLIELRKVLSQRTIPVKKEKKMNSEGRE